jgi:hypothetical protein
MVKVFVWAETFVLTRSVARDDGQATAEYALVLLGAAAVALLLVAWATRTNRIGRLVEFVLDQIVGRVT